MLTSVAYFTCVRFFTQWKEELSLCTYNPVILFQHTQYGYPTYTLCPHALCAMQWKGEVAAGLPGWPEDELVHLEEELSDVLIYLLRLSDRCGIDLAKYVQRDIMYSGFGHS